MAANKKIIIVEDEFIVADDLRLTLEEAGNIVCGIASSVEDARLLLKKHNPGMAILDIHLKGKLTGIDFGRELKDLGIPFIFLSAYSNQTILEAAKATEPYGFLVKPFRDKDVLVAVDIARYRHENSLETALRREQQLMSDLAAIDEEETDPPEKLMKLIIALQSHIPFDFMGLGECSGKILPMEVVGFFRIGLNEYQTIGAHELETISGKKIDVLKKNGEPTDADRKSACYNGEDFRKLCAVYPLKSLLAKTFGLHANLVFYFKNLRNDPRCFSFFSKNQHTYTSEHLALLRRLQTYLVKASEYIIDERKVILPAAGRGDGFKEIIGRDPALLSMLDQASHVAPFETSVLILGETGTGKEKIASYIHEFSPRSSRPFIKINCAALPPTLVESELFGHEKGSFTGAIDKRTGKFEQADGGTVFLDEIGELPMDIQAKLLRVLQEHEIERIGGTSIIKIDVRVIAATNRVLEKEIADGRFRMDLYYRISVFPLQLPPLRERKNDIEGLADFFAQKFCKKVNKRFQGISPNMMSALKEYHWPGNIRELENVIEQSVVLNNGTSTLELKRPLTTMGSPVSKGLPDPQSLDDIKKIQVETEKNYILSVLKKTKGKIRGPGGAAQELSLPASTLESKISKLGIKKEDYL